MQTLNSQCRFATVLLISSPITLVTMEERSYSNFAIFNKILGDLLYIQRYSAYKDGPYIQEALAQVSKHAELEHTAKSFVDLADEFSIKGPAADATHFYRRTVSVFPHSWVLWKQLGIGLDGHFIYTRHCFCVAERLSTFTNDATSLEHLELTMKHLNVPTYTQCISHAGAKISLDTCQPHRGETLRENVCTLHQQETIRRPRGRNPHTPEKGVLLRRWIHSPAVIQ